MLIKVTTTKPERDQQIAANQKNVVNQNENKFRFNRKKISDLGIL